MKILMVLVVVLWAGTGWAEWKEPEACQYADSITVECIGQLNKQFSDGDTNDFITIHSITTGCYASFGSPPRQVEVECQEPQGLPVPVCLKKMEAAMRAAQPYQNYYLSTGDLIHSPYKGMPSEVLAQWEAVKRECWRKP